MEINRSDDNKVKGLYDPNRGKNDRAKRYEFDRTGRAGRTGRLKGLAGLLNRSKFVSIPLPHTSPYFYILRPSLGSR